MALASWCPWQVSSWVRLPLTSPFHAMTSLRQLGCPGCLGHPALDQVTQDVCFLYLWQPDPGRCSVPKRLVSVVSQEPPNWSSRTSGQNLSSSLFLLPAGPCPGMTREPYLLGERRGRRGTIFNLPEARLILSRQHHNDRKLVVIAKVPH